MNELLGEETPDSEDFIVQWLTAAADWIGPNIRVAVERKNDDDNPFCLVTLLSGGEDCTVGDGEDVIQLDIFDVGAQAAKETARLIHRRMAELERNLPTVELWDGRKADADYVQTLMKPSRLDYENDRITRYVARYALGLSYVTA